MGRSLWVPGDQSLASLRALRSRVVQIFQVLLDSSSSFFELHLECVFLSTFKAASRLRGALARVDFKSLENNLHIRGAMKNRTPYRVSP